MEKVFVLDQMYVYVMIGILEMIVQELVQTFHNVQTLLVKENVLIARSATQLLIVNRVLLQPTSAKPLCVGPTGHASRTRTANTACVTRVIPMVEGCLPGQKSIQY